MGEEVLLARASDQASLPLTLIDRIITRTTVEVSTSKKHPLYNKDFTVSKKYRAHDENNEAQIGDTVQIMETRPLSATKRFRLVKITKKAVSNN